MCGPVDGRACARNFTIFSYKNEGKRSHLKRIFRRKKYYPEQRRGRHRIGEYERHFTLLTVCCCALYIQTLYICCEFPFLPYSLRLENNVKASDSRARSRDTHCTFTWCVAVYYCFMIRISNTAI